VISSAAVALAFAGYLSVFSPVSQIATAAGIVVLMTAVNFWGIDLSAKLNVLFTGIEVLGLVIVIWLGANSWGAVDVFHAPQGALGVVEASFLIFFAYLGFGSIVNISEETEDAAATIPKAIVLSILVTTVLYVLVSLSAVALVDWRVLGQSASPLAEVGMAGWGPTAATAVGAIALFATTNTVLILQVSTSRLLYGVSKEEYQVFPTVFSRVHPSRRTPHYAVALVGAATLPFVLLGDIAIVAGLANVMLLVVFVLVNAALLRLRFSRPDAERGFRAPVNFGRLSVTAVLGLVSCVALFVVYIANV
jgi:APA family basic amino acid/polyamine antiporter